MYICAHKPMPLNQRIDMYNWIMHNIGDMHKVWKIKERNQIEFSTWEDMVAFKITFGALGILK